MLTRIPQMDFVIVALPSFAFQQRLRSAVSMRSTQRLEAFDPALDNQPPSSFPLLHEVEGCDHVFNLIL